MHAHVALADATEYEMQAKSLISETMEAYAKFRKT